MIARLPGTSSAQDDDRNATNMALQIAVGTPDPWLRLEATMSAARAMETLDARGCSQCRSGLGKLAAKNADDPHLLIAAAVPRVKTRPSFYVVGLMA